jgi:hypothetical protein
MPFFHPSSWRWWAAALVAALLVFGNMRVATAQTPLPPPYRYENGHLLVGPFRTYYEANGDTAVFGLPLTDAFMEVSGLTVQYFEHARFEWHDRVELTHLGRFYAQDHPQAEAFAWIAADAPVADGSIYIPESGHTLGGAFQQFWMQHGGVTVLGYPISEAFDEPQPDGTIQRVQYFERTILREHPTEEGQSAAIVRDALGMRYSTAFVDPQILAASPPVVILAAGQLRFNPATNDGHNIALAAERLHGAILAPGAHLSFLTAIGEVSEASGYKQGTAIVNGQIVSNNVGGGICSVSTALYRAAWWAGLPITERTNHSYWLRAYADVPGLEAAVYEGVLDLRVANDLPDEVYVEAGTRGDQLFVRLWGRNPGRVVDAAAPDVRASQAEGGEVINARVVHEQGNVLRRERVITRYAPLPQPAPAPAPADEPEPPPSDEPEPTDSSQPR